MADNKPDLSKGIDMVSKICMILIPIVLFYFGNEFKKAQDAENKAQQNYNRITTLLKSLSTNNKLERKLALQFSKDLAKEGNFPLDLISVMEEVLNTDPDLSKDAQSVLSIVNQQAIKSNNTFVEEKIKEVAEDSITRIYMQIPKGYIINKAQQLSDKLKSEGYDMLGIERVGEKKIPLKNEVRYFKDSDEKIAKRLAESIRKMDVSITAEHITGYENKITGSQLEIWLK